MEEAIKGKYVNVIAEAGVNHNGSLELAKKLVDAAKDCGADAVKFQIYQSHRLVTADSELAKYQQEKGYSNQMQMLRKYELDTQQFVQLKQYCDRAGITFLATPFDEESADWLNQMEVEAFKVGSGDITHFPLLRLLRSYNKPILLSTGMSNLGEIEAAIKELGSSSKVVLFHCTSSYPAPLEDVHLNVLHTLQSAFCRDVGYSDHTEGIAVAIAAAAMGYRWIEKHLTLDRSMEGPDHAASLEPIEFKTMVQSIRQVLQAAGHSMKQPAPSEQDTLRKVRRGIYVKSATPAGMKLTEQDLVYLRPERGISAACYKSVAGKTLRRELKPLEQLNWRDLS